MYSIGSVARLAQVSVRTLRHYDDIGLLIPAAVNPRTGYRSYTAEQLHRLHRILVLRDLGIPLAEICALLDENVSVEQLRAVLRLRQQQAHARLDAQERQLARVEARLAQLEDRTLTHFTITMKPLEPVRVAVASADLADYTEIDAAAGQLYSLLHGALARAVVRFSGVSYAFYEDIEEGDRSLRLTAGLPLPEDITIEDDGVSTVVYPAVAQAATTVVRGAPSQFPGAFRALHDWIERTGGQPNRFEREVYLTCDGPRDTWVTELQVVLEATGSRAQVQTVTDSGHSAAQA